MELLKAVQKKFRFESIIIVPSHFPPGKSASASYKKRLEWVKNLFTQKFFKVSALEDSARQTVFGKNIFYHLSVERPTAKFYWILGADQWNQLAFWNEIDSYAGLLEWLVLDRSAHDKSPVGILSKRLNRSSCSYRIAPIRPMPEISSTRIRKCIEEGTMKRNELKWIPHCIQKDVVKVYSGKEDKT